MPRSALRTQKQTGWQIPPLVWLTNNLLIRHILLIGNDYRSQTHGRPLRTPRRAQPLYDSSKLSPRYRGVKARKTLRVIRVDTVEQRLANLLCELCCVFTTHRLVSRLHDIQWDPVQPGVLFGMIHGSHCTDPTPVHRELSILVGEW